MPTLTKPIPPTAALLRHADWRLAIAGFWLLAAVTGMWMLWRYSGTSGTLATAQTSWPGNGLIELNRDGYTLVMFAHPHCPCTRASMAELERIIGKKGSKCAVWIAFYKPADVNPDWEQGNLLHLAKEIPGAHVVVDNDANEARRFGAATSGQMFLYDSQGSLLFNGGITAARGHEGDNVGKDAILDVLDRRSAQCRNTAVFGCPIAP